MSHASGPDNFPKFAPFFGHAWIILSIVIGFVLLGMFFFGPLLMDAGGALWALLRWISSPVI